MLGDLNGDGKMDFATANNTERSVSILYGQGNGAFAPMINYDVGVGPAWITIGDVNGDKRPDLATANQGAGTVTVLTSTLWRTRIGRLAREDHAVLFEFDQGVGAGERRRQVDPPWRRRGAGGLCALPREVRRAKGLAGADVVRHPVLQPGGPDWVGALVGPVLLSAITPPPGRLLDSLGDAAQDPAMSTTPWLRRAVGAAFRCLACVTLIVSLADCGPTRPGPVGVLPDAGTTPGFGACAKVQCHVNADCNDNIACTTDTCTFPDGPEQMGYCRHVPGAGPCPSGQFCLVGAGCRVGRKCGSPADCVDSDPCHANVTCDGATATCSYQLLDRDDDGHAPVVCGGDDCDDTNPHRFKCHVELCDGTNNDCSADGGETKAVCPGGFRECKSGKCTCLAAKTCGANRCQDDDELNCGGCGVSCAKGAMCVTGRCLCPPTGRVDDKAEPILGTDCGGMCVDTFRDGNNCGTCGTGCGALGRCTNGMCSCPAPGMSCGPGMCIDPLTDAANCGDCANECNPGHMCKSGVCDTNCQGLINCSNPCRDAACLSDCRKKASAVAAQLWDALDACITNACPNFDAPCVSAAQKVGGKCRQELVDCQGDP